MTYATGAGQAFLTMAADVARHHHERHDGTGYPDRLAWMQSRWPPGSWPWPTPTTPSAAGGCTSRPCRTLAAVQILTQNSPGQFDPDVLTVFKQVAGRFETIFKEVPE